MKVRMRVDVSGTRDGRPWPPRGEVADLPDDEAAALCAAAMADPVAEPDGDVEKAVPPQKAETRAAPKRQRKPNA